MCDCKWMETWIAITASDQKSRFKNKIFMQEFLVLNQTTRAISLKTGFEMMRWRSDREN